MDNIQSLPNEIWRTAKTFNAEFPHIMVSTIGRCYNTKTNRFIGYVDKKGYKYVGLPNDEKPMILRLMLISFDIPIPEELKKYSLYNIVADHIDHEPSHNWLSNARWLYRKENITTPEAIQNMSDAKKGKYTGERNPRWGKHHSEESKKKISNARSKPVLQYTKTFEFIKQWNSAMDVTRELGIDNANISSCCNGRVKSCGGYIWKYKTA